MGLPDVGLAMLKSLLGLYANEILATNEDLMQTAEIKGKLSGKQSALMFDNIQDRLDRF